jgi:endonuclease G
MNDIINKIFVVLIFTAALTTNAIGQDFEKCRHFFANGKVPTVKHQSELMSRALCFSSFAVLHSGRTKTPIYVAERLNKENLLNAKNNQRSDFFFSDARLPQSERSELIDYKNSGFDRGHMAPAGDMDTMKGMVQSFSLANIVPQAPVNNRKAWANIEKATRKYVMRARGDVYVITGPVFDSNPVTVGIGKVWVPKFLFKFVYDPATQRSWAHWIENTDNARPSKPISYEELRRRTNINF